MPLPPVRLWMFVAASSAAHLSVGWLGALGSSASILPNPRDISTVDFELTFDRGTPAPSPAERAEPPAPRAARREGRARSEASPAPAPAPSAPAPSAPTPQPTPTPSAAEPVTPAVVDLSPLAAARSLVDVRAAPSAGPSGPAKRSAERGVPLDTYLRQVAAARPALTRSEDPELSATRQGGYTFAGNGFDATIDRDGTVHFDDRYADAKFVLKPVVHEDGSVSMVFFRVSFDLTAWAEHMAGNDPYRSERRWFLERTSELRERLALEAFEAALSRANRQLRTQLVTLWRDASMTVDERARRSFALWDETSDDAVGARGRRAIEALLRELCPDPAACGLGPSELERLNAARRNRERFEPHRTERAPGP